MSTSTTAATSVLKRTPLYSAQQALGARFAPFGGWELPVYYSKILQEHEAVRQRVGLFDVSHLGHLELSHPESAALALQPLVTQDLTKLEPGRAVYTPMLDAAGKILDEMILYLLSPTQLRLVVNAANGDKILAWIRDHLESSAQVEDLREQVGTLALQGPRAMALIQQLSQDQFETLPRYALKSGQVAGVTVWGARTGYTGEDGFELFANAQDLERLWNGILAQGQSFGIEPIGLGARDTLRLEAGLPLGGSDLDDETTPLEAGLEWTVSWEKGDFIGKEKLQLQKQEGMTRKLVGFALEGSGIPRAGYQLFHEGRSVGQVTSGTFLPERKGIGLGYVETQLAVAGTKLTIKIHGRTVAAHIVQLPFYRRQR